MERLFYDKKVFDFTKKMSMLALKTEMDLDNIFLNHYNDTCPSCLSKFKLSHDRTVKGVGIVSAVILTNKYKKIIPYVICKNCFPVPSKDKAVQIEAYIMGVLQLEK